MSQPVRAADIALFPAGDGRTFTLVRGGGPRGVLDDGTAEALRSARTFLPIEAHAQRFVARKGWSPSAVPALRDRLAALVQEGFLETLADARSFAASGSNSANIDSVALIACDRPDFTRRALRSLGRFGGEVCVYDDSRDERARTAHREAAKEHGSRYAGLDEKATFADAVARVSGVDRSLVARALLGFDDGHRGGANRNAAYLDQIGCAYLSTDDDALFETVGCPDADSGLVVSSRWDSTEFWFFDDDDSAATDHPSAASPVSACRSVLGETLSNLEGAMDANVDAASPRLLRRLREQPVPIVIVSFGVAGDSGMDSTAYYASRVGRTHARLIESYTRNRRTRSVLRCVTRRTVTDAGHLMLPAAGIDARQSVLPPFMPARRNADGLFGVVITRTNDALIAHLPQAILHRPEPRRQPDSTLFETFETIRCNDLAALAVRSAPSLSSLSEAQRLGALGAYLFERSSGSSLRFAEDLHLERVRQLATIRSAHAALLAGYLDDHPEWEADVERILQRIEETALEPERIVPRDLDGPEPFETFRAYVRDYGRLLCAWRSIVDAALELRRNGVRLSIPPSAARTV